MNKLNDIKLLNLIKKGLTNSEIISITNINPKYIALSARLNKINRFDCFKKRFKFNNLPSRLNIDENFGLWFSGLFDGEGHLGFHYKKRKYITFTIALQINLRKDDERIIKIIHQKLGGNLRIIETTNKQNPNSNPQISWRVSSVKDCAEIIIPLFDKYKLRSKKKKEYKLWRKAILLLYYNSVGGESPYKIKSKLANQLIKLSELMMQMRNYYGKSNI